MICEHQNVVVILRTQALSNFMTHNLLTPWFLRMNMIAAVQSMPGVTQMLFSPAEWIVFGKTPAEIRFIQTFRPFGMNNLTII